MKRNIVLVSGFVMILAAGNESKSSQVAGETGSIPLADFNFEEEASIYELMETRVAANRFADREVPFETVSKILWASHGMTYTEGDTTVHGLDAVSSATEVPRYTISPASRERYIQIYYVAEEGVYEYIPETNMLEQVSEKNMLGGNRNSQFQLLLTYDKERYTFGEEWAYMTIGSSIQNVNLVAGAEDVHVFTQGMFNDGDFSEALGLESSQEPVILLSFGYLE